MLTGDCIRLTQNVAHRDERQVRMSRHHIHAAPEEDRKVQWLKRPFADLVANGIMRVFWKHMGELVDPTCKDREAFWDEGTEPQQSFLDD